MDPRTGGPEPAETGGAGMERLFGRDFGALDAIFEFVSEFFATNGIDASDSLDVQFIVEELFTNLVKYSKGGTHDIAIGLRRVGLHVEIRLTDVDVEGFDITQMPEVDTQQRIAEKQVGGLGIHLVKKMADDISYEYTDRRSRITVLKRLTSG